ncbi:19738_t:CDS:2 [Dentiscutata erythropus]|uniref:19738_t:CDS:1 n=1 Tax=Dentiscutata erythropus TaxID=1348616 RepID=A0A9N8Z9F1_9GLOM|nr:19738_t:CDS:2 [Dentiscutata erythropus]
MDEEARKKHCHLLMFDVPEYGQDAISINENININEIDNPHHFAYYDNGSMFKRTVEPLNHVHNIIEPSALDVSNSSEKPRARKPKRTPRPPNAFILYRKNKQPDVVAQNKNLTNAEVSKVISKMWWKETEEIRFQWEKLADRMKLKHMQDHPDYVYQPKKSGTKKPRKLTKAMITAIAESAFAESKSSPPSFLYPVTPNSPSSSFPSPPLSERSSNQSSTVHTPSSPITAPPIITTQSINNPSMNQRIHNSHNTHNQLIYSQQLPPTPEMVHYELTPQYLLPTSENFMTIDPILSGTPNNTYVHMQHFGNIETNTTKSFFNTSTHNLDTFLDPQPVDKFQYFVQEELFSSSNTVTANSTPDVDDMDAYFDEPCSSQHHFQNIHFSRRSSFASMS